MRCRNPLPAYPSYRLEVVCSTPAASGLGFAARIGWIADSTTLLTPKKAPTATIENPSETLNGDGAVRSDSLYGSPDPLVEAQVDQFAALYPFSLDAFQREAIATLIGDSSVMVASRWKASRENG